MRGLTLVAGLLLGMAGAVSAGENGAPPPASSWRVVIAANFTLPQVTAPIPNSNEAVFAAACATADKERTRETRLLTKNAFNALGVDWETFSATTGVAASVELASIEPELIRDRHQVIECAILRAKSPADNLTVVVAAPDFLKRFTPLFGRKMLLAIPDRRTIYLFPKLVSHYQEYAARVLAAYRKSECPVSREVYELSAGGLTAIGTYED